ncbi:hypothetical protein BJ742DRAFT_784038 [Cladochytrium replicatum]|nr:hypothetical protein BJ742DRAFT_784038 [Cladochytrium replicatum]
MTSHDSLRCVDIKIMGMKFSVVVTNPVALDAHGEDFSSFLWLVPPGPIGAAGLNLSIPFTFTSMKPFDAQVRKQKWKEYRRSLLRKIMWLILYLGIVAIGITLMVLFSMFAGNTRSYHSFVSEPISLGSGFLYKSLELELSQHSTPDVESVSLFSHRPNGHLKQPFELKAELASYPYSSRAFLDVKTSGGEIVFDFSNVKPVPGYYLTVESMQSNGWRFLNVTNYLLESSSPIYRLSVGRNSTKKNMAVPITFSAQPVQWNYTTQELHWLVTISGNLHVIDTSDAKATCADAEQCTLELGAFSDWWLYISGISGDRFDWFYIKYTPRVIVFVFAFVFAVAITVIGLAATFVLLTKNKSAWDLWRAYRSRPAARGFGGQRGTSTERRRMLNSEPDDDDDDVAA